MLAVDFVLDFFYCPKIFYKSDWTKLLYNLFLYTLRLNAFENNCVLSVAEEIWFKCFFCVFCLFCFLPHLYLYLLTAVFRYIWIVYLIMHLVCVVAAAVCLFMCFSVCCCQHCCCHHHHCCHCSPCVNMTKIRFTLSCEV